MNIKTQQNVIDILLDIMPNLRQQISYSKTHMASLYDLWQNEKNNLGNKRIKKSENLSDIKLLISNGYLEDKGSFLKFTQKGCEAIKKMILSDNSCTFDNSNIKKSASVNGRIEDGWYKMNKNKIWQ